MKRVMLNIFLILALVLAFSSAALAQGNDPRVVSAPQSARVTESENGIYIVQMVDKPVVAYEGGIKGLKATKPKAGKKIDPNSPAVVNYVSYLTTKHNEALSKAGGQMIYNYSYSYNGFAAAMSVAQANKLASVEGVLAVSGDELRTVDTSTTPDFLGLTADGGLWDMGYTGEDIIIGDVDSGIWPESMSFTDRTGTNPNGKEGKLGYQQIPGWHGKCTPGEEFNASMCNQKLIGAQYFNAGYGGNAGIDAARPWEFNSPRDYNGHGTHTASTAGGNSGVLAEASDVDLGTISGMAPRARISAYKALWSNEDGSQASGFTVDLVAAIDQAVADGVDVINYSVSGSTTLMNSSVAISFLFAADAGVFVASSAGNEGPGASTVAHNTPWQTTVAAGTHDRYYAGTVTLGNGSEYSGASIDSRGAGPADLVYAGNAGDALCAIGSLDPSLVTGKIVVCDRGIYARVDKSYAVMEAGGIGMVLANVSPSSINADLHYVPTVHVDEVAGAAIRAYAQTAGATATLMGGVLETAEAPEVAAFSSRGPALAGSGDLLKPDIMAPGVDVLAAVAPPGNNGRNFDFYSGTSMSSPHIAGIAALLKDAHPDWSPMMIKSAMMTTTSTETNQGNPIPGGYFDYGAGQVVPNSAFDPGLVYNAGWNDWLAFLCETSTAVSAGTCNALESFGYSLDPSDLNYPSISIGALAGEQTVTRTVTNVGPAGTYAVLVDAPAGIDVTVDPVSLTLGEGESTSFTVTFKANESAVADDWTFGSLTWSHGPHHVTSPLAILPVAIAAPAELHGTGTEGSLDFDVTFGYTGEYTAAPHGLVPADMQADTVDDDPTDDINSALDTCDWSSFPYKCTGITWHEFTIPAGAVYARFSLFDNYTDGADDLDLYVWGPGFFGSSGSGTSAEEVYAVNPAPGVYEIAVHGWGTDGPDAEYTLFNWAFGPDSGNLTVTPPPTAVTGSTEAVTVEWTGLNADTKYLGAVSHSDATDLLGLTLIRVDTD
ncbi:MAG: S8 family serine peptidase [Anaerolineales bacterium]|nr:S8 family serine peptidase [Anaerolineales bacterium]